MSDGIIQAQDRYSLIELRKLGNEWILYLSRAVKDGERRTALLDSMNENDDVGVSDLMFSFWGICCGEHSLRF